MTLSPWPSSSARRRRKSSASAPSAATPPPRMPPRTLSGSSAWPGTPRCPSRSVSTIHEGAATEGARHTCTAPMASAAWCSPGGGAPSAGSAAELLIQLSPTYEGTLDIVAIGPLTNIARALDLDPSLTERVRSLTVMGGAVWTAGNITAHAEANIANDPAAAAVVLDAGFATTLVPLDVTLDHGFTDAEAHTLQGRGDDLKIGRAHV